MESVSTNLSKVFAMGIVLALAALAFVGCTSAATIYVPDNYTTIQAAVNNATAGDTIIVRNGTYYENVVVNTSLTLQGEDRNTTIIDGGGNGDVVNMTADNVTISGFTVRHSGQNAGINLYSCNTTIMGNNVLNNDYGIYLFRSNNNIISNNNVSSRYVLSIYLSYSSNNTISNNTISRYDRGIRLDTNSNYNKIISNTISSKGYAAIMLLKNYNNTIVGNTLSATGCCLGGIGIWVSGSGHTIVNNTLSSCSDRGIMLKHAYNNVISGNIISSDGTYGIVISYTNSSIISNNYISNNDNGITLTQHAEKNIIYCNTITNNYRGIYSYTSLGADNQIYHNNIINNNYQALDTGNGTLWNKEYPIGGNYWSDHTCTGNPSDGSQPYPISSGAGAVDHHPYERMNGWLTAPPKGDLNHDGTLTPADAVISLQIAASGGCDGAADVSGDNRITSLDALMILQAAARAISL